ncbi:PorV/PorQ family protein [candidate division WOR-3 bacterium]|nr:PorV/PorQ family protein [candidate division WOR-3 bacterium]
MKDEMLNVKGEMLGAQRFVFPRTLFKNCFLLTSYFLLLTSYFFLPTLAFARLGGCGASFLSIGGGARALSLGGAYSAFAEGVDAIYWNPAGLAKIRRTSASFSHVNLFAGMSEENIGIVIPIKDGAIGISAIALLSGKIEETTMDNWEGTGDYFSANDFAVGISYSRMLTDKFNAGFTVKGINQNIAKLMANGIVFDIGGIYNTKLKNLRFGFMIQNFGADMAYSGETLDTIIGGHTATYKSESYPLPLNFQLGIAVDLLSTSLYKLTLISDLVHPSDQEATYALGIEYCLNSKYFARLGYTKKNNRGLSAGFGIMTPVAIVGQIIVDYSYENHQYLSGIHRISLGFSM